MIRARAKSQGAFLAFTVWAVVAVALSAGCASPGPRGEIPFGRWSGHGEFVYANWGWKTGSEKSEQTGNAKQSVESEESAKLQLQSIHRRYPTSLSIQPGRLGGHDVVVLEIISDRGPIPDSDAPRITHLKFILEPNKRISDSTVLYRGVDFRFINRENEESDSNLINAPFVASCITMEGTTTLQIVYLDTFVDTLRFRNDRVSKTGMFVKEEARENGEAAFIHWSEKLHRNK